MSVNDVVNEYDVYSVAAMHLGVIVMLAELLEINTEY